MTLPSRRFAWYGRLSTTDKQDASLSFPSQRKACVTKAAEIGGEIVADFTDEEAGRRDDRIGWSRLVQEAKDPETRRFNAVIVYATSRLSRELFHALAYERELAKAGVEVFYALTAGDQTSPEGRLIRHLFQALDQFDVEKLGREVRRGQTENTIQGYRNGGRAPYGYRLHHVPHPNPARARVGDSKSRLVIDPDQAPVVVEIFDRFLAGWGYKQIANHLNRPGGPSTPKHVDSKRNTSGKWSTSTIRSMLDNPVYTGRLYWNRLDFRAVKQREGPLVRRSEDEWVEAGERHEAIISDDQFQRARTERAARRSGRSSPRRRSPNHFYLLGGFVHCATGHNPLRMQGKTRKGNTYYACGYRRSYGDLAADALGHGKWQYVREDQLVEGVDRFFATRIFGAQRLAAFRSQHKVLNRQIDSSSTAERGRLRHEHTALEQRLERQLTAIEAGVDPALVGRRIEEIRAELSNVETALAALDQETPDSPVSLDDSCAVLDALPNLGSRLAKADPELRRAVFSAFRLSVEIDRNSGLIRMKALVSSAFGRATDLDDLAVAHKGIAGARFARNGDRRVVEPYRLAA